MENPPPPPPPLNLTLPLPTDDILLEIISKLPVKSLLRFRCVSKSCRALISDRHSLSKLPPAMAGIFTAGSGSSGSSSSSNVFSSGGGDSKFQFLGLRASATYADPASIDATLSFLPPPLYPHLRVLDCCSGLLLLSSAASLLVCNPATRNWTQVPNPPADSMESVLAFDPRYKIVSFPLPDNPMRPLGLDKVEVFSSDTGEWREVSEITGLDVVNFTNTRIVFLNGIVHVLDVYSGQTFALDLEEKDCREIDWPHVPRIPRTGLCAHCFGVSGGLLHFAFIGNGVLHVMVLDDVPSNRYALKYRQSVRAISRKVPGGASGLDIVAFHADVDLIFLQIRGKLFSYSMVSSKLEEMGCNVNGERPFFAYSPCYLEDMNL